MKSRPYSSIRLTLLAACFAFSVISGAYHACPPMQPPAEQEMAGMDCHNMKMPQAPQKQVKNCCTDHTCLKCFSSPFASARVMQNPQSVKPIEHVPLMEVTMTSHIPDSLERPPKVA